MGILPSLRVIGPVLAFFLLTGPSLAKPLVVLDAAHGGEDAGIRADGETEKEWNLEFAQALEKALEEKGFEVVQTRKKDEAVPREKREAIINTSRAQAVIVLHAEREWTGKVEGPLLVVEPPHAVVGGASTDLGRWGEVTASDFRRSLRLAREIAQALGVGTQLSSLSDSRALAGESTSDDSLILCAPHVDLRNLLPPAVVLAPLFLSSGTDRKRFSGSAQVAGFAARVADGLRDFLYREPARPAPPPETVPGSEGSP